MSKRSDAFAVIGTYGGILAVAYAVLWYLQPPQITLVFPTGAIVPPPPPPPPTPQMLTGDAISVYPARKYVAAVNISAPLSWAASASKVKSFAEDQGFSNVVVTEDARPAGTPLLAPKADYFVSATFTGADAKSFSRKSGPVSIAEAWQVA